MSPDPTRGRSRVTVVEGFDVRLGGQGIVPDFGARALARHVLFLGAVGSGKTHAIRVLVRELRDAAGPDDVFVFFDTKGDYHRVFGSDGDAALGPGGDVHWNIFRDLEPATDEGLADEVHEIATTLFSTALDAAGQNAFFAVAARDVLAAVLLAMARSGQECSNASLRAQLEAPADELSFLLTRHDDLAGTARYLTSSAATADGVLAFLQQTVNAAFAGGFRLPGDFSVRSFVRGKGGRALFVSYDLAIGARLLPVYRVLIDLAIKEALEIGRAGWPGHVYFVLDEFALLPALSHLGDGINFGRELGLRFVVGSQNVHQVLSAYGQDRGRSILSGFGTVVAFRLLDAASRDVVRQRYGANRKVVTMRGGAVDEPTQHSFVSGNVIEDWVFSQHGVGDCVVAPFSGAPFEYRFP